MGQTGVKKATLSGTDILFECQECGKSLTIDCRGAGLNIRCPQCGAELEVPIPEGVDLAEIDKEITAAATSEDKTVVNTIPIETAELPSAGADQSGALRKELETLRIRNQSLAKQHNDVLKTVKAVQLQVREFHKALDGLSEAFDVLTGPESDETPKAG